MDGFGEFVHSFSVEKNVFIFVIYFFINLHIAPLLCVCCFFFHERIVYVFFSLRGKQRKVPKGSPLHAAHCCTIFSSCASHLSSSLVSLDQTLYRGAEIKFKVFLWMLLCTIFSLSLSLAPFSLSFPLKIQYNRHKKGDVQKKQALPPLFAP